MLARLGNVFSWTANALSLLILAFGLWAISQSDHPANWEPWLFFTTLAILTYGLGRALRYVLAAY